MASSVQGMAFTAGDHLSLENKENETFSWHDTADEPNSGDFFEQYVMLDGTDAGSPTGGGEGSFDSLPEAHDMPAFSPPVAGSLPSHSGQQQQQPSAGSMTNGSITNHSQGVPASTTAQSLQPQHQQNHANRQTRGRPDMLHHQQHNTMEQNDLSLSTYELSGGGSISDSELLKLEGLTMRSPRVNLPPTSASVPPSPHSRSTSPRKGGRLEAIYAKIRNKAANLQGKSRQQPQLDMQPPAISTAQMGSPASKATGKSKPYNLHIKKDHLPLSPPLTGSMADLSHQGLTADNGMQFVNGFLDDPFFDPSSLLGSMPQTNGGVGPNTPLHTPLLNTNFTSSAGGVSSQPAIVWQLGPDGKTLWSPGSMDMQRTTDPSSFMGGNGDGDDRWWNDPDAMDTDNTGMDNSIFQQQQQQQQHAGRNMNNAAMDLTMQQLQQLQQQQHQNGGGEFHYPLPPGEDFAASGLMIHMPQPRTPSAAVLNTCYFPGAGQHQSNAQSKRPRPKAPSSGARHHHHPSGAMTSPRKTRTASGSGASGGGANGNGNGRTTPSPSPTPGEGSGHHPSRRLHRRSASMNTLNHGIITGGGPGDGLGPTQPAAIRKKRSWTGRRLGATEAAAAAAARNSNHHERRHSSNGTNGHNHHHHQNKSTTKTGAGAGGGGSNIAGGGAGAAGAGLGFVNFTPQDHNILMTGVAPSGSSKTKARREKEAAEKQRRLSEAVLKAVAAAGGDLAKLEQEGIMLS
ncbi:regulatory protein weta [Rhypophila decipiens]|uniref:Regulatory protein weta n=1 Tax=Rhypophila decipiens TaxID=261697 RepID=A0AAN6YN57_9PEZI|nr:regulatory protein weta [Rhypophila decipiens]